MAVTHAGNGANQITFEEHDGANNAKRVSIVSGGLAAGVVTLAPSPNFIGIVTIANPGAAATGNVTLNPSPNFIGIVTVANPGSFTGNVTLDAGSKTGIVGNVTLSDSKAFIGLTTTTLGASPAFIGIATVIQANSARSILGNLTLSDSKAFIGLTTTTLGASPAFIGIVTIANALANTGNVTLNPSPSFIGIVTVASDIKKDTYVSAVAFTITLASLANSTAGVGRQSTLVTGNTAPSALIGVKVKTGTSPTINTLIYVYLIRGDGTLNDDAAGASDAGLTVVNAPLLGTILNNSASNGQTFTALFDTKFLGSLGPTFGIALVNSTGVALDSTGGSFTAEYTLIT